MLYSDEQIERFGEEFVQNFLRGEIKKPHLANEENQYYQGAEERDLEAVLNTNPNSPLFTMSFELRKQP
ncbi:MAG: hypothetical protein FWF88_03175 [Peptococcaceae bacterium]|jgi:hypothetical protein|nr:hypothetical protein [Peptococcaceae bacterium]